MKKTIIFFFTWCALSSAFAQNGYVKHVFEIGRGTTVFPKWKSWDISRVPITDVAYTFFLNKNMGIRLTHHRNHKEMPKGDEYKYKYLTPNSPHYLYKYISSRGIICTDILATYRLNYKKHYLWGAAGLSWRKDFRDGWYQIPDIAFRDEGDAIVKRLGYVASLSYQYRMFRNVGISGEVLFRQSKDIPNTFTYGLRLSYLIWNKKKEKESK